MAGGILCFLANKYFKKGTWLYIALVLAIIIVGLFMHITVNEPNGDALSSNVGGLKMGLHIITGCSAAFLVPYFAQHPKIWGE